MRKRIVFGSFLAVVILFSLPMNPLVGQVETEPVISNQTEFIKPEPKNFQQKSYQLLDSLTLYEEILKSQNPELFDIYISEYKCESCLKLSETTPVDITDILACIWWTALGLLLLILFPPIGIWILRDYAIPACNEIS